MIEKTRLVQLLNQLTPAEWRAFGKFLDSPFFNQRDDLVRLFQALQTELGKKGNAATRDDLFADALPDRTISPQDMRLLMSYLTKQIEMFLAIRQFQDDPAAVQLYLSKAFNRKDLPDLAKKAAEQAEHILEKSTLRNADFHDFRFHLKNETLTFQPEKPADKVRILSDLTEALHLNFAAHLLRHANFLWNEKSFYKVSNIAETSLPFLQDMLHWIETEGHLDKPALRVYYFAYRLQSEPTEAAAWFKQFKSAIFVDAACFLPEELRTLHLLAINFCVRQLNAGQEQYFHEVLDFYKEGLNSGTLLLHNLSPHTYYNIVVAAIKTGELDWAERFISTYKNNLDKKERESAFSFNMARLHFARKNYGETMLLLQKANYRDLLLNLAAKTILLKIYYEQNEMDVLQSHLEAMSHYLQRKRVIGYHKSNYQNIILLAKRLIQLPPGEMSATQKLEQKILLTEPLTEREWFLKMLAKQ